MSANVPTDICFSFSGLIRRGGETGPHRDGWGLAFYDGKGYRAFRDTESSCRSEIAQFLRRHPIKSCLAISHIRRANRGAVTLANTHPFDRELWGRVWSFAHNGQLRGIKKYPLDGYRPVGTTDSEYAFCWLLGRLRQRFDAPPKRLEGLWRVIDECAQELHTLGVCNFVLSDGRYLYAHCGNRLSWITRRAPFGPARLADAEMTVDFSTVTTPKDIVTVVATRPLTLDERWNIMQPGEVALFQGGERLR